MYYWNIRKLKEQNITIILITHDRHLAGDLTDYYLELDEFLNYLFYKVGENKDIIHRRLKVLLNPDVDYLRFALIAAIWTFAPLIGIVVVIRDYHRQYIKSLFTSRCNIGVLCKLLQYLVNIYRLYG